MGATKLFIWPTYTPIIPSMGEKEIITESQMKEELSMAYVHAIAARAGFMCYRPNCPDLEGIDMVITCVDRPLPQSTIIPKLELQLKATSTHSVNGDYIAFSLPINNYRKLIGKSGHPRLLVLFLLPPDGEEWLVHSEDELVTRKCAYWLSLKNLQPVPNTSDVTVYVPSANCLSPETIKEMMIKTSMEEEFTDAT